MECTILWETDSTGPAGEPVVPAIPRTYPTVTPLNGGLSFTTSEYGRFIPIVFGADKLTGNVFWATNFEVKEFTNKGVKYFYNTCSFALGICEGEIDAVLRMWLGEKLLIDNTANVDENGIMQPNSDGFILGATIDLVSADSPLKNLSDSDRQTQITVYNGSETQLPDPTMVAAEGYSLTPGYRGIAYVFFKNFIVTDSTIPNILVEVIANSNPLLPRLYGAFETPQTYFDSPKTNLLLYNPSYDQYVIMGVDESGDGLVVNGIGYGVFDGNKLEQLNQWEVKDTFSITQFDVFSVTQTHDLSSGNLLIQHNTGGAQGILYVFNLFAGTIVDTLGPGGDVFGHSLATGFGALQVGCCSFVYLPPGQVPMDIFCGVGGAGGVLGCDVGFASINEDGQITMLSVLANCLPSDRTIRSYPLILPTAFITANPTFFDGADTLGAHVYFFVQTNPSGVDTVMRVFRARIDGGGMTLGSPSIEETTSIDLEKMGGSGFSHQIKKVMLDPSDNCFVLVVTVDQRSDRMVKYSPYTGLVVWSTPVEYRNLEIQAGATEILLGQKYAWITPGSNVDSIDIKTGVVTRVVESLDDQLLPEPIGDQQFYNGYENSITYLSEDAGQFLVKVFIDRISRSNVPLADIVTNLLHRVGMRETETDVDDLQALSLVGYTVTGVKSLSTIFGELAQVFRFDIIESNAQIIYKTRGSASSFTIDHAKLNDVSEQGWFLRRQENDFARTRKLSLTYRDVDREYTDNVQSVALPKYTNSRFDEDSAISVTVPVVLHSDDAKKLAEILLYSKIIYEQTYEGKLPPYFLNLDPGDVGELVLPDETITARLSMVTSGNGENRSIAFKATREDADIYNDQVTLFGNIGRFNSSEIDPLTPRVDPFIMLFPFRSDEEAASTDTDYFMFLTFLNNRVTTVPAKNVTVIVNGVDSYTVAPPANYPTWGLVLDPPVSRTAIYSTDYVSQLRVKILSQTGATLTSAASKAALVDNSQMNLAYVGGELIQFQTVTDNGGGYFTFTGLHRGRFGTEFVIGSHTAGERFVLLGDNLGILDEGSVRRLSIAQGDSPRKVAQVFMNTNNPFQPAPVSFYTALNVRPWTVAAFKGAYNGDDLELSWQRRTRFNGQWTDDGDFEVVPLNEASESYIVYLYTNPATFIFTDASTYLQRLELSTSAYTYDAATQALDGFDRDVDNLFVRVSQSGALSPNDVGAVVQFTVEHKRV